MERENIIESLHHPVREQHYVLPGTKVDIPIPERAKERHYREKEKRAKSNNNADPESRN